MYARGVRVAIGVTLTCGLAGCRALLDLESPVLQIDASTSGSDAPLDGADARHDTPAPVMCPPGYTSVSGGSSKYKLISAAAAFATHHANCNDDAPGATHLASIETIEERAAIAVLIGNAPAYIGAAQQPNQATVSAGWFVFSGGAVPPSFWESGQPNDITTAGEDNEENLAILAPGGFRDVTGDITYAGLCECDGIPIDATVESYLP